MSEELPTLFAQVAAGLWVRNGDDVLQAEAFYQVLTLIANTTVYITITNTGRVNKSNRY